VTLQCNAIWSATGSAKQANSPLIEVSSPWSSNALFSHSVSSTNHYRIPGPPHGGGGRRAAGGGRRRPPILVGIFVSPQGDLIWRLAMGANAWERDEYYYFTIIPVYLQGGHI